MNDNKGIRAYRDLLLKHWKMATGIILVCTLAAVAASFLVKPVYQGTARVRIDLSRSTGVLKTAIGTPFFVADPFQTQVNLIRSRVIGEKVVRDMNLNIRVIKKPAHATLEIKGVYFPDDFPGGQYTLRVQGDGYEIRKKDTLVGAGKFGESFDCEGAVLVIKGRGLQDGDEALIRVAGVQETAQALVGRVKVLMEGPTELMDIMVTAEDPHTAARLTNAYAREYSAFITEMDRERSRVLRKFLEGQVADLRTELDSLEGELARLKKEYGIFQPDIQGQMIVQSMADLEKERIAVSTGLKFLREEYPEAYKNAKELAPITDSSYTMREAELMSLKQQKTALSAIYTPDHPTLRLLDARIKSLEQSLAAHKIRIYQDNLASLNTLYANYASQLGNFPAKVMEVQRLSMKVSAGEDVYSTLLRNLYEARINEHQEIGMVVLVDSALPVPYPIQPRKKFNAALGLLAGILLSVIGIFILEALDVSVKSKSELERITGASCMAIVPKTKNLEAGRAMAMEAFKLMAVSLDYMGLEEGTKALIITSASPGDGKSTLATGLARALAAMGKKVLLVDSDMRKPRLHEEFRVPLAPGLSDFLAGKQKLEDVLRPIDGVMLVAGGTVPPDPSALLSRQAVEDFLGAVRERFDYVLFDSPPILAVADPATLASRASGVILVARYGITKKEDVAEAVDRLKSSGGRLLGVVFNDVPLEIRRYTNKYYGGQGRGKFWPWKRK